MWEVAKKHIDDLLKDYHKVVSFYEQNKPENMKISSVGKYSHIQIQMKPIESFHVNLIIYRQKTDVKTVWYVVLNEEKNTAYRKVIYEG